MNFLNQANDLRLEFGNDKSPKLRNFNVAAIIAFRDYEGNVQTIDGCNSEPCSLTGSICAERCALTSLRMLPYKKLLGVYIVTDSERPIMPGLLCREYMSSYPLDELDPRTFDVLVAGINEDGSVRENSLIKSNLNLLYPAKSCWSGLRISSVVERKEEISSMVDDYLTLNDDPDFNLIYECALDSSRSATSQFFGLNYSAAVMLEDGSVVHSKQIIAMEYGCSIDPIAMLAKEISEGKKKIRSVVLVDSLGAVHAPFAIGRSFLSEHTGEEGIAWYSDWEGRPLESSLVLKSIAVADLCPLKPDFKNDLC